MTLVDLPDADKSCLFGSLCPTLTMDGKNKVWEDNQEISEQHGYVPTKDEVLKNGIIS